MRKKPKKEVDRAHNNVNNSSMTMTPKELERAIKKSGISRKELATRVGVTEAAISQWLSGKRKMHPVFGKAVRQAIEKKGAA